MSIDAATRNLQSQVSEFIAERMGLHFPPERYADLGRGLAGAAKEFGFANADAYAEWLLTSQPARADLQDLACHLTIGETYFFREKRTFEALAESALPELMRRRRDNGRRLRLWSAACCTGEEAYSLAILLHQIIPDLADWHITILATDINGRFLKKAAAGVYGEWSFRESPPWFIERYFRRTSGGRYEILPQIKKMVTFARLNLAEDHFPALATETNAMDVIFCRNVLMYFTPAQAAKAVRHLRCALVDDGWLAVSPCESSQTLFSQFAPANFPGAILYQKSDDKIQYAPPSPPAWWSEAIPDAVPPFEPDLLLTPQEFMPEAAPPDPVALDDAPNPAAFSRQARVLANQGRLAEALACCDRWVEADKLNASGHYLRAVVSQELGDRGEARRSLQRAIYLNPGFVLAHFALGNLARTADRNDGADKHFGNAARLLKACPPGEILPESDGLTASRLSEIISSITDPEIAS